MKAFFDWFRDVYLAVTTVAEGMWVTARTMFKTYERKAFAQIYEYPETPCRSKPGTADFTGST
jgi:NADH-quinone oxidoreductase subunit I